MNVYINDTKRTMTASKASYSTIATMALYHLPVHKRIAPTVSYCLPDESTWVSIPPRSSISVSEGMKFTVINGNLVEKIGLASQETPAGAETTEEPENPQPRVRLKPGAIERRKAELAAKGLPWPPDFTPEMIAEEEARVKKLMAPFEERYQAQQAAKATSGIGPEDAQLKDALIIINVMFEEMVCAGLRTRGREMAGRLLYSAGYTEKVNKLNSLT